MMGDVDRYLNPFRGSVPYLSFFFGWGLLSIKLGRWKLVSEI